MNRNYKMPRNLTLCSFLLFLGIINLTAQYSPQNRIISYNQQLCYDSTFTIRYYIPSGGFHEFLKNPKRLEFLLYRNFSDEPEIINMQKEDNYWMTSFSIKDTIVKIVLFAVRAVDSLELINDNFLDNNQNQYWDLILHHPGGKPVKGAHQSKAISYAGFSNIRKENIQTAISEIENELIHYPFNFSARLLFYSLLLKRYQNDDASGDFIKNDVETILKEAPQNETVLLYAISAYRMIGNENDIKEIQNQLMRINPKNTIEVWKAFQSIHEIEDEMMRVKELQSFLEDFPGSQFEETALAQLATSFTSRDDTTQILDTARKLMLRARQPIGANALSRISIALLKYPQYVNQAYRFISKAMQIINTSDLSSKPPEVELTDWKEQINQMNSYYNSVYARILIQKGEEKKGVDLLEKESQALLRSDIFFELANVYFQKGDFGKAIIPFARASYFEDPIADSSYAMFLTLTKKLNKSGQESENILNDQLIWVENKYIDKVLSKRSIRKSPDFDLEEKTGQWVRLSDQKGNIILLCFWASWSEHSKRLLVDIQELSEIYGRDVLFLTVSVDKDDSSIDHFLKRNRLFLPVLFYRDTDQQFRLQGVPTIFVIDEDMNIHFEHKGYRPDLMRILEVELEDLLGPVGE